MIVYGLDFTSAPDAHNSEARKVKRLMLAMCKLDNDVLKLEELRLLNRTKGSFAGFEEWLAGTGDIENSGRSWIAGIDFPFGQPAQLVKELGWPNGSWEAYVQHVGAMGKQAFEDQIKSYRDSKADGQKHLFREIDDRTNSQSPMTLSGTPVGKMFFQGSPRLCDAGVSVIPVRANDAKQIVVEAYPALVARKWIGLKQGYKSDDSARRDDVFMKCARCDIVSAIRGKDKNNCRPSCKDWYGFSVEMSDDYAKDCVDDFTGDMLDSILSAIQAAWAFRQGMDNNYGVPVKSNLLEGWICDPETLPDKY